MFISPRHWMFALALGSSLFLRAVVAQEAASRLAIIPLPASIKTRNGTFHVGKTAEVLVEGNGAQIGRIANALASVLSSAADRNAMCGSSASVRVA